MHCSGRHHSGRRLYLTRFGDSILQVHPECHASGTIAAHGPFASVCIPHSHFNIRVIDWRHHDQSIRPNAKVSIADCSSQLFRTLWHLSGESVNKDVVVASSMHLDERHVTQWSSSQIDGVAADRYVTAILPWKRTVASSLNLQSELNQNHQRSRWFLAFVDT